MLQIDPTNTSEQAVAGKLRVCVDEVFRVSLLDWITYHNLPFKIVESLQAGTIPIRTPDRQPYLRVKSLDVVERCRRGAFPAAFLHGE